MLRHAPVMSCRPDSTSSWFRSFEGRRYLRHFGGLIALKIVLLTILYFIFIAPQPRADTSPDHVFDAVRGTHSAPAAAIPDKPADNQTQRESNP